jgi:ketosteroid isomerase-like protein
LLQGWLDIGAMGIFSLLCFIRAGQSILGFCLLTCTFISLISSGSGRTSNEFQPCSKPCPLAAMATETSLTMDNLEEQELQDFTKLWDAAMVTNNSNEIAKFMSDDWVIIGSDGITSKATFLQWITSGTVTHHRMDSDEMNIKLYGDTGIVISRGTSAGTYNGENFSLYEWSTSVFRKNEGSWLCVLTMLTLVNNPK